MGVLAAPQFTGRSAKASYLRIVTDVVDVRGLLLGGRHRRFGALDDMTVTQASAVWELRRATRCLVVSSTNPLLSGFITSARP
jgi:hypothetical protein